VRQGRPEQALSPGHAGNYGTAPRLPATQSSAPMPASRRGGLGVRHRELIGDFLGGGPYLATTPLPSLPWLRPPRI